MLVYFADLAHTYSTENESLMVPLNIGYLKSYALKQQKNKYTNAFNHIGKKISHIRCALTLVRI